MTQGNEHAGLKRSYFDCLLYSLANVYYSVLFDHFSQCMKTSTSICSHCRLLVTLMQQVPFAGYFNFAWNLWIVNWLSQSWCKRLSRTDSAFTYPCRGQASRIGHCQPSCCGWSWHALRLNFSASSTACAFAWQRWSHRNREASSFQRSHTWRIVSARFSFCIRRN